MPRYGAHILSDYDPNRMVRVACEKCGRAGQFRASTLMDRYGRDAVLPDVLRKIAECPRAANMSDPCGAIYLDRLS
jgi:hypothetical protein